MDPITTLSGPISVAAFDDDVDAVGTAVLAEIMQLLDKVNEVIGGLTDVSDLLDETIVDVEAMSDHELRIDNLESAASTNLVYDSSPFPSDTVLLLTAADVLAYRTINIRGSTPGITNIKLVLPSVNQAVAPITVIAHDLASLKIFVDGSWMTGVASNYGADAGYVLMSVASGNGMCMQFTVGKNPVDSLQYWTPIGPYSGLMITP
jgi:hypothetical protein